MNSKLKLKRRTTLLFDEWLESLRTGTNCSRLFVAASGYESRCTNLVSRLDESSPGIFEKWFSKLVYGFKDHIDTLSRPANDKFFKQLGCELQAIGTSDCQHFIDSTSVAIRKLISEADDQRVEIHVDYSSMPRSWYCRFPRMAENILRDGDKVFMWYSKGIYPDQVIPTAGVDDFRIFEGKASPSPRLRTHVIGLGFDRVRSHAIWSVLDPENLIAFYADPAARPEYVEKVEKDNTEVLHAANYRLKVDVNDPARAVDRLLAITNEFCCLGDMIFVPDGPKPLILAASIMPSLSGKNGVVCFHVRRRKSESIAPIDVSTEFPPTALVFDA